MKLESDPIELYVRVEDGPVAIAGLNGAGVDQERPLWEEIVGHEFFPIGEASANYVLTVRRAVTAVGDVKSTTKQLLDAVEILGLAWSFAGGTRLPLVDRRVHLEPRLSANAEEVVLELETRAGIRSVSSAQTIYAEHIGGYRCPPLRYAREIGIAMREDDRLRLTLWSLDNAHLLRTDRSNGWAFFLYNVAEGLKWIHNGGRPARSALDVTRDDWNWFTEYTNRYRHLRRARDPMDRLDRSRAFRIARACVRRELERRGLPVPP